MDSKREYQKAVDYLCEMIKDGRLVTGSRLPAERTVSEELSISRNSTREALRMLENMGIIESRRGSGNYIAENTSKTISGIVEMMLLLKRTTREEVSSFRKNMEKAVCRTIIENGSLCRWKEKISDALNRFQTAESVAEQSEADGEFHSLLIRATENQFWISMLEPVTEVYSKWIDEVLFSAGDELKLQLQTAHTAIADAIEKGDYQACDNAIDRHYNLLLPAINKGEMNYEIQTGDF